MPILITTTEFDAFLDGPSSDEFLQWASDLFTLATGITDTPTDPVEARILKRAILQMAWYLQEDHLNRAEYMSGFSGETIGGYSYNKMQKTIEGGDSTNVPAFDFAIDYFGKKGIKDSSLVTSENVFKEPFLPENTW